MTHIEKNKANSAYGAISSSLKKYMKLEEKQVIKNSQIR
jgi:hypothetical protein